MPDGTDDSTADASRESTAAADPRPDETAARAADAPSDPSTSSSSDAPTDSSAEPSTDPSSEPASDERRTPPEPASESRRANEGTWFGLAPHAKPLVQAGVVLGFGLGGFFDGIVLHQVLQVHHMVSARTPPTDVAGMEVNVLADGLFHVGAYAFTIAGIVLLYRAVRTPRVPSAGRAILGSTLMGFGLFNLVEGLVDHHLLVLHRVWPAGPGPPIVWDLLFLLSGVLLLVGGYAIVRSDDAVSAAARSRTDQ